MEGLLTRHHGDAGRLHDGTEKKVAREELYKDDGESAA